MLIVPLIPTPAQKLSIVLAGQACDIAVYQKSTGLYLDLAVNAAPMLYGVLCLNGVQLVIDAYHGFIGDLAFYDTQGLSDPFYTGLGDRYILAYLEVTDLS
jgi:hypothetical protein